MNMSLMLEYLSALEQNNNREWFHANKPQYQEAKQAFEGLIGELMMELRKIDDSIPVMEPKELTFKLQRDTRFSHDKSPYNPAFRAHISSKGKLPIPVGYFLMLQPGGRSFCGGGLFADMFKDATAMVRDYINTHGGQWNEIISAPSFQRLFTVKGTALKKVPQGYSPAHPQAEYLKYKSWYLEFPLSDAQLLEKDFVGFAVNLFETMKPFNAFLNRALVDFQMPAR